MRWLSTCAALAAFMALQPIAAARADGPSPANDIAERFAADAERTARRAAEQERQRRIETEMRRNEADMLARARAEAAAREVAEREVARRAEEERLATERRLEEQRRHEQAAREERERLETARRAEEERQARLAAEEKQRQDAARVAEEERLKAAAETARREALARQRAAEADRISEALREAREAHERRQQARVAEPPPTAPQSEPVREQVPMTAAIPAPTQPIESQTGRYAVLLVMEPGNRGIRRHNKTADPLLCLEDGCYVSNGPSNPAMLLHRRKAFGIGRTFGERAGACGNSLGCVFRDVEIARFPSFLQPVDMRIMRHDRREAQPVEGGSDCYLAAGRLGCRRPIRADSYTIWLVPEKMAAAIGSDALAQAVANGLVGDEHVQHPAAVWRR